MNEFLVRYIEGKDSSWIDITSGEQFEVCNVPYNLAKHGLCATLGKKVIKKIVDDGFQPLVFMSKGKQEELPKRIRAEFLDIYKHKQYWQFEPHEVFEIQRGIDEGLSVSEIARRVSAPEEAVRKATYKLIKSVKVLNRTRVKRSRKNKPQKITKQKRLR